MTEYIDLDTPLEVKVAYDNTYKPYTSTLRELLDVNHIPYTAADVRPVVKAHWYWDKDGMDWNIGAWRCSACKAMSPMWWNTDRGNPMHKSGHNFCPNCGARMDGDDDS